MGQLRLVALLGLLGSLSLPKPTEAQGSGGDPSDYISDAIPSSLEYNLLSCFLRTAEDATYLQSIQMEPGIDVWSPSLRKGSNATIRVTAVDAQELLLSNLTCDAVTLLGYGEEPANMLTTKYVTVSYESCSESP